jgi:hypothetical protein
MEKKGVVFVKIDGETTLSNFKQKLLKAVGIILELNRFASEILWSQK